MFADAISLVSRSMFPIFRFDQLSKTMQRIGANGTGFFINSDGYFVSVAHVFDKPGTLTSYRYFGHLPENINHKPLAISEIARDDHHDIFVGKIDVMPFGSLQLSSQEPPIGRSVCISGYPLATITQAKTGQLDLAGVRRYFQPSFVLDRVNIQSKGSGTTRLHQGFLVRDVGLFGMSGGPVFDVDGIVLGIQGSVTAPRISKAADGREISVENAMVIASKAVISLLQKNNIAYSEKLLTPKTQLVAPVIANSTLKGAGSTASASLTKRRARK